MILKNEKAEKSLIITSLVNAASSTEPGRLFLFTTLRPQDTETNFLIL